MDNLYVALANLGGGFAMAAAILFLHRESLRSFREEMKAERDSFAAALDKVVAHCKDEMERVVAGYLRRD